MDEARRYLEGGRLEQVRLALLLLDNAAELQIERRVREALNSENLGERVRDRASALRIPKGYSEGLDGLAAWQPLSAKDKERLSKSFPAKLDYLSERHQVLDASIARVLSYLHRYRNEAYHEGRVRRETIRTAAVILFEINCLLLLDVFRVSMFASNEDYSWLEERFRVDRAGSLLGGGESLERIVDELRALVVPGLPAVTETLVRHLESRFEDVWDAVDFILSTTPAESREDALKIAQLDPNVDGREIDAILAAFQPRWPESMVRELENRIGEVQAAADRLDAFSRFSRLETELEKIEVPVFATASEIDHAIQLEFDRMRGK
ncbi:MAG: hypothetical protein FIA92_06355 [Chloroflexi bacterium]|nr:hypothetical protein [Chloroflexota bacterium]